MGEDYLRYGETLLPIESVFDRGGVWYHAKGLDALSLDDTQLEDRCKTIPRAEAEQLMERYTKQYEALPSRRLKRKAEEGCISRMQNHTFRARNATSFRQGVLCFSCKSVRGTAGQPPGQNGE